MKPLQIIAICFFLGLCFNQATQAQRVSATLNVNAFNIENFGQSNDDAVLDFSGKTSVSLNLRYFTDTKWAFRLGGGIENLKYDVAGTGIQTDYQAQKKAIKGILGLEKHIDVFDFLKLYPGIIIPITLKSENIIEDNLQNIKDDGLGAGLGLVLGANVSVLKRIRIGLECNYNYEIFKTEVWNQPNATSDLDIKGMNFDTAFTVGIEF